MTNKPIANRECPNSKQCAEWDFLANRKNRSAWILVEQSSINGRQGVCYAIPPGCEITVNTAARFIVSGNRVTVLSIASRTKNKQWWEFWK